MSNSTSQRIRRHPRRPSAMALPAVIALTLLAGACSSSSGGSKDGGTLPVGGLTLLTGEFADFGKGAQQGLEAGVAEVNGHGGVLGKKLKLITADSTSDPVDAVPAAAKLISINHVLFEDGIAGPIADATAGQFTRAGIPVLTPGGDVNFDKNKDPLVWRLTPSDSQLGVAMSLYARKKGYQTAALMFTNGSTAQGLAAVVKSTFAAQGGTILSSQTLQPDLSSYQSEVGKALSGHPDVVLIEMDAPTASVVFHEMNSINSLSTPIVGTDTTVGADFVKAVGAKLANRALVSLEGGTFDSPAATVFTSAVKGVSKEAPLANASYCYDGIILASLAMVEEKAASKSAIVKGIPKVTATGGTPVYSFAQGVDALKQGKRISYIGASGPFEYNEFHNVFGPFIAVRVGLDGTSYATELSLTPEELAAATK